MVLLGIYSWTILKLSPDTFQEANISNELNLLHTQTIFINTKVKSNKYEHAIKYFSIHRWIQEFISNIKYIN